MLDIDVERNAYGRQLDSFITRLEDAPALRGAEAVFIRAPVIRRTGPGVEVLAARARPTPCSCGRGRSGPPPSTPR